MIACVYPQSQPITRSLLLLLPCVCLPPQVRETMENDPATARRLLGRLDIKLLSPLSVAQLVVDAMTPNKYKACGCTLGRRGGIVQLMDWGGSFCFFLFFLLVLQEFQIRV